MNNSTYIWLTKFLNKEANIDDLRSLELWINNPDNEFEFNEFIKANAIANDLMGDYDLEKAKKVFLKNVRGERIKNFPFHKVAAAVVVAGLFLSMVFIYNDWGSPSEEVVGIEKSNPVNNMLPGSDKAILTLEDGSSVALENDVDFNSDKVDSDGKTLKYKNTSGESSTQEIAFHTLTVPRSGQFNVELSDGTIVWLNSETQIVYPVKFEVNNPRSLTLKYGEIYLDVSSAENHDGSPFYVENQYQTIEVLGTEFNVKAYGDGANIKTTLVEGKIKLKASDKNHILLPNQQFSMNKKKGTYTIATVDVYDDIAWKDGIFSFKDESLEEIIRVLSKWYDFNVEYRGDIDTSEMFVGVMRKNQDLSEIMENFKNFGIIKAYKIEKNRLVLE
ncbi:FecR family protein [Flagellimonas sp.]|uniref:FecR family protein n=1 Tax=Flagellimonas sp. TaxID=2058762 RepID=UPI003BAFF69D